MTKENEMNGCQDCGGKHGPFVEAVACDLAHYPIDVVKARLEAMCLSNTQVDDLIHRASIAETPDGPDV